MRRAGFVTGAVVALLLALVPGASASSGRWQPLPPHPGYAGAQEPVVSAPSWILYDDTNSWVIGARDADVQRSPASTTKMMTALVVADLAGFDEQVTISVTAPEAGEAEVGLVAGEVFTVGELLSVMLVRSANDAALALAEYVGGSVEGFTDLMNQKAAEMGMRNSHFANPHGLDVEGHYTSAADEMTMARAILANPQLAAMVRLTQISFPPAPDGTQRGGIATNRLLDRYPGAIGVKTGYTSQASLVLAAAAERDGRLLLAVVMGSEGAEGHFADAAAILDYGFDRARVPTLALANDSSLAAAARLEAMTWLGASGLLLAPEPVVVPAETVVRGAGTVPGWRDALEWTRHYWGWLTGDG